MRIPEERRVKAHIVDKRPHACQTDRCVVALVWIPAVVAGVRVGEDGGATPDPRGLRPPLPSCTSRQALGGADFP